MNFLAHLFLADQTPASIVGNMLGDFVPHDYENLYPPEIFAGIAMHKAVDKFTDQHPLFVKSKARIDGRYRILKGVMIDVFYDHFLAKNWQAYSSTNLADFCTDVYRVLVSYEGELPPGLKYLIPRMIEHNWLLSYRSISGIDKVLKGLSGRISYKNILHEGVAELEQNYDLLEADFTNYFPELCNHVDSFRDKKAAV